MSPPIYEPLLNQDEEEDLCPKFEQVLKEIFSRFDKDKDGELSLDEVQGFAKETNGTKFDEETLEELGLNFEHNEETGNLLLSGFLQMYSLQTQADEDETRRDLATLGYSFALKYVGREEAEKERIQNELVEESFEEEGSEENEEGEKPSESEGK